MRILSRTAGSLALRAAVLSLAVIAVGACGRKGAAPALSRSPVETVRAGLQERIGVAGAASGPVFCRRDLLCGSAVLPDHYRKRDFRPGWIDDRLDLAKPRAFLSALGSVVEDGLDPANYHRAAIDALLTAIDRAARKGLRGVRPDDLVDLEMLLTDGFLLCASHLAHGQVDPATLHSEWHIKGRIEDFAAALDKGLESGDLSGALDSLRPRFPVYGQLRSLYDEYAKLGATGGWPPFAAGPKLVKGDRDPRVADLRRTLIARGDLAAAAASSDADLFDEALETAVKSFQERHGLDADGAVGAGTAAALNVTASGRLMQIKANLERWRWVPDDLGDPHVLVNIAGYFVWFYRDGRPALGMKAIVGRDYRQTPDFDSRITKVTINPPWNVPDLLARADLLPLIQKDPGYLAKMGIRVLSGWGRGAPEIDPAKVDWSKVTADNLAYRFIQDPGPQNALGRLSFTFPNEFAVFMHDTPARGLFDKAERDFSSGCIRIENALAMAVEVLRDDPDWTEDSLLDAIATGETQEIRVLKPPAIHILYWTAWLGDDGRRQFRGDVYERDAALVKALEERAAASAPAR